MNDNRGTCWSVTINNPTPDDEDFIELARQRGWQVDGQREKGAQGTEHYQLIVKTPQVRFSAVKKMFPRAHIELARNSKALETYVHKVESRTGELPSQADRYPSQKRFFELVWSVIIEDHTSGTFSSEFDRAANDRLRIPINALNRATDVLIRRGYVVEGMASNPMTIAIWKQFHPALLARFRSGETTRQTDARLESEVNVPMLEHNHASQDVSQEAHQSPPPPPCPSCGKSHNYWQACP